MTDDQGKNTDAAPEGVVPGEATEKTLPPDSTAVDQGQTTQEEPTLEQKRKIGSRETRAVKAVLDTAQPEETPDDLSARVEALTNEVNRLSQRPQHPFPSYLGAAMGILTLIGAAFLAYIGVNDMKKLDERITSEVGVVSTALDERARALTTAFDEHRRSAATTTYVDEKVAEAEARAATHDESRGQTLTALQQRLEGVVRTQTDDKQRTAAEIENVKSN